MAPVDPRLVAWREFYVVVGSSGAALIGLQFVVVTLIAGLRGRTDAAALSAFATPTVMHLTAALVIAATMCAPWPSPVPIAATLTAFGIGGLAYGAYIVRGAFRQSEYRPVWEDWVWFALLPRAAYLLLTVGAFLLRSSPSRALFAIAAAALALLLIGIHNAWDTVTHLVITGPRRGRGRPHTPGPGGGPPA